ncbi:CBS domain-containing protein [Cognatiluteimonas profundi]|uniref:CBS domain-containing protein n=1 Tax=Cognatiluteimonas profundi TaxID=2594501 RepID=UPI00131AAEDF|nr:CBS domain-containing protein [Lysobacter profundi]
MDIQSVMTANPTCCTPQTTLREVAQLMRDKDCGEIPVVDAQRRPLGVITDRDIAIRAVAQGIDTTATVSDYMTSPATTVSEDSSLAQVVDVMEDQQIRRVLVVDARGVVAGIVAQADIARAGGDSRTAEVVKQVSQPGSH